MAQQISTQKENFSKYKIRTSPQAIRREERRKEVVRLRLQGLRGWEIRDAIVAQRDKYLEPGVKYSDSAVFSDITAAIEMTRKELYELAREFIPQEVERLEEREEYLKEIAQKPLEAIRDMSLYVAGELDPEQVEIYKGLVDSYTKIDSRYQSIAERRAKLLGLDAPTKHEVDQRTVNITIDDWKEAREQMQTSVEGTFEIVENDQT